MASPGGKAGPPVSTTHACLHQVEYKPSLPFSVLVLSDLEGFLDDLRA